MIETRRKAGPTMAVAVTVDIPGGNQQVYEQLTAKLFQDGKLPEGWQVTSTGAVSGSPVRCVTG
jgi:hypothetical protein